MIFLLICGFDFRMQRAASVAYTTDTHQREQPLLQLLLPNKVEYYCNSKVNNTTEQNSNLRRHSSGNCDVVPRKVQVSTEVIHVVCILKYAADINRYFFRY